MRDRSVLGIMLAAFVVGCGARNSTSGVAAPGEGDLPVASLLAGEEATGFARATTPEPFIFPRDHGPHAAFRSEWWYLTGILRGRDRTGASRRFGYQLTLFRQALVAERMKRASAWASRDIYMGHLALADIDGPPSGAGKAGDARFYARQRFARDGLGLAGAELDPFSVWVERWRISSEAQQEGKARPGEHRVSSGTRASGGTDIFPLTVNATDGMTFVNAEATGADERLVGTVVRPANAPTTSAPALGIALSIEPGRGPILQGDRGYSVKGTRPGNASFYYSFTRLPTNGRVAIDDQVFTVEGTSWLDREWSTSALEPDIVGWDWLGAHLSDGRDLMLYRLRRGDGTMSSASRATLVGPDGSTRQFDPTAFKLEPRGHWQSSDGRARYPAAFHLLIGAEALDVTIEPMLADQELRLAIRYWEGAVALAGVASGRAITGEGYLELTGYAPAETRLQR